MASYQVTVAPTSEPLTRAEAKAYLRVDGTDEDTLIDSLIVSAREFVETEIWRPLMSQTIVYWMDFDDITTGVFNINKAPIQSITSVQYYDSSNNLQTLSATNYEYDLFSNPCRFKLINVPSCYDKMNTMKITFVAGYSSAANVPSKIKQAMYLLIGSWFENRQEEVTGTQVSQFEMTARALLYSYRNNLLLC